MTIRVLLRSSARSRSAAAWTLSSSVRTATRASFASTAAAAAGNSATTTTTATTTATAATTATPPLASHATTTAAASSPPAAAPRSLLANLAELSKARLSALVVSTTACGFVACTGPAAALAYPALPTLAAASIGTALCSGSAAALNQIFEIDRDRRMKRTANRPLPSGAVTKEFATGAAATAGMAGAAVLWAGTNPVATALGVGNVILYAGAYTGLKTRSEWNTWAGAVVGAVPPVIGWTAAGGSALDPECLFLGSALFLWQFPHFMALNWMYRKDYARGGFRMVATDDPRGDRTSALIRNYGWYLASMPVISAAAGLTSGMFAVEGLLLNAYALNVARKFDKDRSNGNARKVFLTSLWYLPCFMTLFLIHSRRWNEEEDEDTSENALEDKSRVAGWVRKIQTTGREMCLHEGIASRDVVGIFFGSDPTSDEKNKSQTPIDGSKCPVALGKKAVALASASASSAATTTAAMAMTPSSDDEEEKRRS